MSIFFCVYLLGKNQVSTTQASICDEIGNFKCEGKYDDDEGCVYNRKSNDDTEDKDDNIFNLIHRINPYESSESRIMFSTWNLDHV